MWFLWMRHSKPFSQCHKIVWCRRINTFCHVNIQRIKAFIACGRHTIKSVNGNYLHCIARSFLLPKSVIKAVNTHMDTKNRRIFNPLSFSFSIAFCIHSSIFVYPIFHVEFKVRNKFQQRFSVLNSCNLWFNFYHYHQFECHRLSIRLEIVSKLPLCFGFEWN